MLDWLKATGCVFALFLGVFALAAAAQAGPEDGRIVHGSGSISQSGTHTDIRQNSDFLATHWGSFNIAAHESVQAHQPGASSRLLIRVDGGGATNIAGNYTSNGITILENRNGVQFSRGAIVNVGGLLATSSRISGVSGANWQLNGTGGAVVNHGQIAAGAGGVVLAAVRVENHGKITAQGGDVSLGAGSAFTVDFAGSLVGFEVKKAADGASVVHDGVIESQGGIVSLSAQEAQAVRTNVVSVGGVVKATRLERRGGVVYLSGGTQGIAEVSGDVSASDKVQTTGEYVVVKEGALLKAPEILVGGDFQGGGDVQTAQRTLVERGALLNAGAGGRVIVWSDDVTWFNGDISAPDGFAEVSGKETLASVHLAGIDVGELLLDPADIIIAAAGTGDAVTADIAAADPGMTLTLDVATINTFAGALSLAASDTIMVDGEINKPTGDLTLTAGGVLTLGANITTSAGALNLTGTGGITLGGDTTLTGGAITITANTMNIGTRALTITASNGSLTLNADIIADATSTGAIILTAINGALTLGGGSDVIANAAALTLSSTGTNSNLVPCPSCALRVMILNFTQDPAFVSVVFGDNQNNAPYAFAGSVSVQEVNLTTSAPQALLIWMEANGRSFSLTTTGVLTLNNSFQIGQSSDDVTFSGASIVLADTFTQIRARNITLRGAVSTSLPVVLLNAEGVLTIHNDINVGTGALNLVSGADISNGGAMTLPILTADTVSLMQDGAFGAAALFTFAANTLTLTTAAAQTVQPWMVAGTTRALSLMAGGDITLNDNINLGTTRSLSLTAGGDITLSGNIDLGTRGLTLIAGMGSSTANSVSAQQITAGSLSVRAPGNITLNGNINLGAGALDLRAGVGDTTGNVVNGGTARTIMAGALNLTQDGLFTDTLFNPASTASGAVSLRISTEVAQTIHPWMVSLGTGDFSLQGASGVTLTSITTPADALARNEGTIDLRAATVNLGAEVSATGITLIADTIALTDATIITAILAGSVALTGTIDNFVDLTIQTSGTGRIVLNSDIINLSNDFDRGGSLTLTAPGGITFTHEDGLTLSIGSVMFNGDVVSTNLPFTATTFGGSITLSGDINTGTGNITVSASSSLTFRAVRLTGGDITLTAGSGIIASNFDLRVNAGGDITFSTGSAGINLGTGRFDLRADTNNDGIGAIINSGTVRTLTAGDVFLQQTGTFAATSLFAATGNNVTGSVSVRLTAGVPQTIRSWMVDLGGTDFSLAGVDGVVLSSITTTTALTRTGTIELYATRINLDGDLTAGAVVLRADTIVRTGLTGSLSITATSGGITTTGADGSTGVPTLDSTVTPLTTLTLTQNSAFGSSAPFTFNTVLTSLTLQTAAPQTAYSWMAISGGSVSLTSTGGDITIGGAIDVGTGSLTLIASGNILPGTPRPRLIADTVNLELTGADSVFTSRPFLGTSQIDTLTITTQADQTYLVWMAPPAGTNRNLTIDSQGAITINSTAINLGTGNLTLNSSFDIILTNAAGLTITAGDVSVFAGSVTDIDTSGEERVLLNVPHLMVMATTGDIAISNIVMSMARVELRADNGAITVEPRFRMNRGLPSITASVLLMRQSVAFADGLLSVRNNNVTGAVQLRVTGMGVDQPIHEWMTNLGDGDFSLRGEGAVLTSITTEAALTRTGTINLRATAITLGGALTGGVVALRTNTITVPGALAAIHATAGDITAITITDMGDAGQERPTLTNATSLSLEQTSAFGGRGTLPFIFADTVIGTALTLSTRSEQLVRGWMIRVGTNLTITSSDRVLVNTAIGAGNRNLGGGDLTLTSTGAAVRIVANITTGGAITLSGGTGGINLNSTPTSTGTVTLTGAAITLSGNALSNRDLIITATTGLLTLSGAINTGTSALTLSGSSGIALGGALTLTAGSITLSAITGAANASLTITADTLTLNNDITLTGTTSILALRSGQGAITGTGSLTASTVRLRQFAAFADTEPFIFTNGIGSLLLITDANQDVHDWMIARDRNLTVRSSRRVRVMGAAIGSGNRNLGTGSLTLRSTGGIVRILADISTTGSLTLIGPGAISNGGVVVRPLLTASTVSFTQDAAFDATGLFRFGAATGSLEFTTTVNQDVHNWMIVPDTNLTVTSSNRVRVLAAIGSGVTGRNLGTGSLTLTSTGGDVRIVADITTTGDVTLDASGILTISSDITLTGGGNLTLSGGGAISNGGNVGANRPTLTASTVSFRQDAAFATTGPFRFGSATGALEFTTTMNQDVHNWMIRENTNLTVTSSDRVRVLAAIGSGVTGRNLGNGSLTLTSTGRIVRIVADISTTGDATITASSILTINNNINIGTGALILEATSFDFGSSVDLAAGSHSFTPNMACNTGTSPSCTVNAP